MRNYSKTVGALAAASTLVAGNASAEILTGFDGEVHVGYSNMYEFRFVDQGNDLIEAGVDLAYDAGMFGLSAGAWYGVWDTAPTPDGNNSDELDLYAGVSYNMHDLTLELGHITYYFPDSPGDTSHEVYLSADYELPFGLGFNSTYYYDWERNSGWYWDNSIGYSYAINGCLSAEIGAGVAFADGHALQRPTGTDVTAGGPTEDGFQGWYLTAAMPWEFRDGVTLTPYVKYTDGEDDLSTNLAGNGGQDFFIAGVSLAVGF